jgi:hypothetical protein
MAYFQLTWVLSPSTRRTMNGAASYRTQKPGQYEVLVLQIRGYAMPMSSPSSFVTDAYPLQAPRAAVEGFSHALVNERPPDEDPPLSVSFSRTGWQDAGAQVSTSDTSRGGMAQCHRPAAKIT